MVKRTQEEQVLEYMQNHGGITNFEAFNNLGITRLSARIFNLRKQGHLIVTNNKKHTDRNGSKGYHAEYVLVEL